MIRSLGLALLTFFVAGACRPRVESHPASVAPAEGRDAWATDSAAAQGIDPARLDAMVRALAQTRRHGIDAILIARRGKLVFELYFDYDGDRPHDLRSATKSITGLMVGAAVHRGLLDPSDPLRDHLEAAREGDGQVEDLLRMHSARLCDDRTRSSPGQEERMYRRRDWVDFYFGLPFDESHAPDSPGHYCTAGFVVLGAVVAAAARRPFDELAESWFFGPMGIRDAKWAHDPRGQVDSGGHLRLRARDFLAFGQLLLDEGQWRGEALLSPEWIAQIEAGATQLEGLGYVHGWWIEPALRVEGHPDPLRVIFASGNGGQALYVIPELELTVGFFGHNYNSPRAALPFVMMQRVILPAVRPEGR